MRPVKLSAAVAMVAVMAAAPFAQRSTHAPGFSAAGKAALSKQIADAVSRGDTPGVAELVVDRNGVLYEAAAGNADIEKRVDMRTDAIFNIASMTKPITSVAVMMLMEQGKVKLDDPVSKYLGAAYEHPPVITKFDAGDASYEAHPAKNVMTIRQLLSHTSGIGYGFTHPIEYALVGKTRKGEWELPLVDEPGTKWNYSSSTRVLGFIVEQVTGTELEPWYQEHIFRPLGMVDTSWAVGAEKQSRLPVQYSRATGTVAALPKTPVPSMPAAPFRGDGGLYSTIEDYGRFVRMLLNGGTLGPATILTPASVKMMGENQIGSLFVELQGDADKQRTKPFPLGAGKDKFGLGFQLASNDPAMTAFRSPGSMSWAGIFNTEFWVDPVKHIGAVQMMQLLPFYDEGAIRTLRGFEAAVYRNVQ